MAVIQYLLVAEPHTILAVAPGVALAVGPRTGKLHRSDITKLGGYGVQRVFVLYGRNKDVVPGTYYPDQQDLAA